MQKHLCVNHFDFCMNTREFNLELTCLAYCAKWWLCRSVFYMILSESQEQCRWTMKRVVVVVAYSLGKSSEMLSSALKHLFSSASCTISHICAPWLASSFPRWVCICILNCSLLQRVLKFAHVYLFSLVISLKSLLSCAVSTWPHIDLFVNQIFFFLGTPILHLCV